MTASNWPGLQRAHCTTVEGRKGAREAAPAEGRRGESKEGDKYEKGVVAGREVTDETGAENEDEGQCEAVRSSFPLQTHYHVSQRNLRNEVFFH